MDQDKIGKFVAKLRKEKNMTQEELAERLGVSSKSISRWENGKCMPDLSLLGPLSKELDVSVNSILSGKKNDEKDSQNIFEENIVNIFSKVDKDNKKRRLRNIIITLSIIFIGIPLLVLSISQIFKVPFLPSFSSFKIMNKANQFYKALQANDLDKIDKLLTNDVKNEMCWSTGNDYQTKQNFLDNLTALNSFPDRVKYTSFRVKQFYYSINSNEAWEYVVNEDGTTSTPTSVCSLPSKIGFVVTYELCFEDWTDSKACIYLYFQLNDDNKLLFMVDSKDINLRENKAYKKYSPIYFPLSINNACYNPLHVLVNGVFMGFQLETIEESVDSWLNR